MKKLIISNDVQLKKEKYYELVLAIQERFFDYQIEELSIKNLSWKEYQNKVQDAETIVVLFAGYNLKRYWNNLVKHLVTPSKTLYGINIEAHFFKIPRIKTLSILLHSHRLLLHNEGER
ncbi:hypothetical protein MJH12_13300 [bacterium]|nr:hypothetical protein [bacterium]